MKNIKVPNFFKKVLIWRVKNVDSRHFMMFLSLLIGIGSGLAAVVIFNLVHYIQYLLEHGINKEQFNFLFLLYPIIGISITVLFIKFVLRQPVGHGIPSVLYAISKNQGHIKPHNMFSSIITSAVTVGFGGSVGLEGPTVATGGAIGSNIGKLFRVPFRQKVLLLGCASAGAMAAIFKAPIAAIVFAFEVIMLDLTTRSIVPILIASASATLTSYFFLGAQVVYPFNLQYDVHLNDLPYFVLLGIISGLVSVHFTRVYMTIGKKFDKIKNQGIKLLIGAIILGTLIFFFPSLYGDGYEVVNSALHGNYDYLFEHSIFSKLSDSVIAAFVLMLVIILLKVVATSVTFGAGGIGGIFAPTLFMGANTGLLFASVLKYIGFKDINTSNFALVGMAGLIAGVLHAPLTGLFLIADLTHGYSFFIPLMITATFSYATIKYFETNNVYTIQLAKRKALMTHHADKNALMLMKVDKLIETNFSTIDRDATLGELVKVISESKRNIFPVVDKENYFIGVVNLDDIRNIIFQPKLYDKIKVRELLTVPSTSVSVDESMDDVVKKIHQSGRFNIVVLKEGKYLGFVSRANVLLNYRQILQSFSSD